MLCYLTGTEPYYLKRIKDGPFQPTIANGDAKPESKWTLDERRVVVQDQRLKCIIMSCLPNDIIELVITCVSAKETWTNLVHSFEGPSNTKENRIMDLKLEYQTFRVKSTESLSQTYTCYKTLLNEFANDGVNLSKHEINVGFMNSLPEKWLTFSQGLRNANHTQTLDLADIYGRFDFQENSNDEVDERSSDEYLRDLDIEYHKRAFLASKEELMNNYSSVSKGFQPKFTPKLIQSSSNSNSQADLKFQKDYKAEYKKMKAKLALLEAKVSDEEEVTHVKVLMALADDELTVGESHARNGEWVDITIRKVNTLLSMDEDADWQNYLKYINIDLKFVEEQRLNLLSKYNKMVFELNKCRDELLILKQAKLDAVTFQIQNTKLTKLNHALQEQLKANKKINEKWLTSSKKGASPSSEVMPLTFQPHSPKERPGLGIMKHTKPETQDSSNKSILGTVTVNETKQTTPLVPTEVKDTEQESKLNELAKLVKMLIDEKVNSIQKTQESNSKIQKTKSSKSVDSSKISQI
ncbi:hypothetical protein Tco_1304719 [Tanacetum coccineum]